MIYFYDFYEIFKKEKKADGTSGTDRLLSISTTERWSVPL
jgi:hypothetical protein